MGMKKHRSDPDHIDRKGSRRSFLRKFGLLAGASVVPQKNLARISSLLQAVLTDEELCLRKFDIARKESLADRPIREIMVAMGTSFLGTPYAAHTLESEGQEKLVVNLRELDCVTFVETTLALSRCVKLGTFDFENFRRQLEFIRYRGGVINGYTSRLHYFSDWIFDNAQKGVVQDLTEEMGGVPCEKEIVFMSTHADSYRQLSDEGVLRTIREQEVALNSRKAFILPKETLENVSEAIRPGDILGITSSIDGLDVSHTGMAVYTNGVLKYLHAPLSGGAVQISSDSLVEYLKSHKTQTGVLIARPLGPRA